MKKPKRPCIACGKTVACLGALPGGKGRHRHNCPHGKPCVAGIQNQGWNPGGGMHQIHNPCCARIAETAYAIQKEEGLSWNRAFKKAVKQRPTIRVARLQSLARVNSDKLPDAVEHNGVRKEWVGIGWIDCGAPHGDEVLVVE